MIRRIHIFGASGTGTTTLGEALAQALGFPKFDTDSYFWVQTDPPFQAIREQTERKDLLRQALSRNESWVLSGSLCGWGDFTIPMFDLVVFLWLPPDVRMQRLKEREIERYGSDVEDPNSSTHQGSKEFLRWAAGYDKGGLNMRSKSSHEKWISTLPYPVVRIEGDRTLQESLNTVLSEISPNKNLKPNV